MKIFAEPDGSFSWRKGLTAIMAVTYVYSTVVQLHTEATLPAEYLGIFYMVFAFYFLKNVKTPFKLTKNDT